MLFPAYVAATVRTHLHRRTVDVVDASRGDSAFLDAAGPSFRRTLLAVRSHGLEHVADLALRAEAESAECRLSWRYPLYHGGYRLREVARAMRRADVALMLNRADATFAAGAFGLPPERLLVVPNGVPASLVVEDDVPAVGSAGGGVRVVQIGSYLLRKGIAYGNAALREVLERHPGLTVAFLGTGCPRERVLADFDPSTHSRISVVAVYRNEDLPGFLRPADVNLYPALSDGFPVALLEAMARGLPSVVTATPGPLETARDGVNALVVPPRDGRALGAALDLLVRDAALRRRLAAGARRTARRYTWPRVAEDNLDIYRELLGRKLRAGSAGPPGARTRAESPSSRPLDRRGSPGQAGKPRVTALGPVDHGRADAGRGAPQEKPTRMTGELR